VSAPRAIRRTPVRRQFERTGALLALLAMLLASGSHWVALQTVAFGSMLVRFSQSVPLGEAVTMTFDGEHPCPLCHAVQEGRQQEEEQRPVLGLDSRIDLALVTPDRGLPPRIVAAKDLVSPPVFAWLARTEGPPKPRPRAG
jgi:hypothetical protein